jgi:predicted HicB family RNase H-like nuclease
MRAMDEAIIAEVRREGESLIAWKNIPPELHERLKEAAEAHRRSLNREVIACLEQVVRAQRVDPEALIARARRLRELTED